jgi:hypothetical protein
MILSEETYFFHLDFLFFTLAPLSFHISYKNFICKTNHIVANCDAANAMTMTSGLGPIAAISHKWNIIHHGCFLA